MILCVVIVSPNRFGLRAKGAATDACFGNCNEPSVLGCIAKKVDLWHYTKKDLCHAMSLKGYSGNRTWIASFSHCYARLRATDRTQTFRFNDVI